MSAATAPQRPSFSFASTSRNTVSGTTFAFLAPAAIIFAVTRPSHRLAEERSLALHRAVAKRLREDRSLVVRAKERVAGWLRDGSVAEIYASGWMELLESPLSNLVARMTERDEAMHELRQNSPFAGVLAARDRWEILRSVARRAEP